MPNKMKRFLMWKKHKSPSAETAGRSRKDSGNSLSTKSNVNEEYLNAFRSNSYEEIWDIVQGKLGIISTTNTTTTSTGCSSSSLSSPFYLDLSELLLEPRQETLKSMIDNLNFHRLLVEYFEASLRACNICELLLRSIEQTRSDYRKIKRVIKMSKRVLVHDHEYHNNPDHHQEHIDQYSRAIFRELAAIALLKNPLSVISPLQYRDLRDGFMVLLRKLTSKGKKIKRREKLKRLCKKVGGAGLVVTHIALLIALLVFAFHSVFGIVATPPLVGCSAVYLSNRKKKRATDSPAPQLPGAGLGEQLDVAAKGMFILINDFDTTCQMVRRLHDEVEHRKSVAEICVRNRKFELLREVVKEFRDEDSSFMEQLEELEGHIYLCLLTMNRSRRLVIQEIIATQK